ncbi:MAG: arabinan endo-1,5-alpha-L-arabinosidase [Kineosporiaceae bacterium]
MTRTPRRPLLAVAGATIVGCALAGTAAGAAPTPAAPTGVAPAAAATPLVADTFEDGSVGAWSAKPAQKLTLGVVSGGASGTPGKALRVTGVRKIKVGPKRAVDTSTLVKGGWYMLSASVRPQGGAPTAVSLTIQQKLPGTVTYPARSTGDWASAQTAFQWQGKGKLVIAATFPVGCPGDAAPPAFLLDDVRLVALGGPAPVPVPPPCTTPTPTTSSPSPTTSSPTPTPTPSGTPFPTSGPTTPPSSYPYPGRVTGDVAAHDPTVVKRPDGSYLVATTGRGLPLKVSTDRTAFRAAGSAFPNGTPWTATYTTGDLWAPDLTYANGQYWLYYAASQFGSSTSGIFLATSPTGDAGTWTNRGLVISSTASSGWNAIDPDLVIDAQGRWRLAFGSFWSGLKMIDIDPSTGLRSGSSLVSLASRPSAGGAIEAADLIVRGGSYYLFASFDACCKGAASTYRIMVGRSSSPTGPFVDRTGKAMTDGGGTQLLAGHGSIHGPGHSAVIRDVDGDVLFYHWYTDSGASQLGINLLGWDAQGWPFVY